MDLNSAFVFQPPVRYDSNGGKEQGDKEAGGRKTRRGNEMRNQTGHFVCRETSADTKHPVGLLRLPVLEYNSRSCHVSSLPTIHHSAEWRRSREEGRQSEQLKADAVRLCHPLLFFSPSRCQSPSLTCRLSLSSPQSHTFFDCDTEPCEYSISFR